MGILTWVVFLLALLALAGWAYGRTYGMPAGGIRPAAWVDPLGLVGLLFLIAFVLLLIFTPPAE